MKTRTKTKPTKRDALTQADKELIREPEPTEKLAIIIRHIHGKRSSCAKLDGGHKIVPRSKGGLFTAKVLHVGYVRMRTLHAGSTDEETRWYEVSNLAEFDGPTCEDAAETFIKLIKGRTTNRGAKCIADGPVVRVARWKQRGAQDTTVLRYV